MDEDELRQLMLAADVPPSGADVRRAVADGRRARARRMVFSSTAAGVAVLAAVGTFAAFGPMRAGPSGIEPPATGGTRSAGGAPASGCTAAYLEVPAGTTAMARAIDPAGNLIGGFVDPQHPHPARWGEGGLLERLQGVTGDVADIGADGSVVGYEVNQADESTGWVLAGAQKIELARLSGYRWTNPSAVNASGVVAGWVHGQSLDQTAPVTWSRDGAVHALRVPAGAGDKDVLSATARGIGDDGTVVGGVHGVPVAWAPDGTPRALPLPAGSQGGQAWAVAGKYAYGSAGPTAVRWDLTAGTVTELPPGGDLGARAGTAGGMALLTGNGSDVPAQRVALNGVSDPLTGPHGEPAMAFAISADGTTIAGVVAEGEGRPAVWHCR
ncbi:hypothetical protein AB0M46_45410 [Dactylosporangium sp. NPDC051485]|uniref:hypothetical protein n=1 Tax=Dactylosporangium sp. NPDC051485 TaxID=3154846 RepID=UPI00341DA48F